MHFSICTIYTVHSKHSVVNVGSNKFMRELGIVYLKENNKHDKLARNVAFCQSAS